MTAYYTEIKKFTFNHPPNGADITALIRDHELHDYGMDIKRENNTQMGLVSMSPYRYEVIFSKRRGEA